MVIKWAFVSAVWLRPVSFECVLVCIRFRLQRAGVVIHLSSTIRAISLLRKNLLFLFCTRKTLRTSRVKQARRQTMESDDSADIPLNIVQSRLANSADRSHAYDDSTSNQPSSFSRLKKKRQPKRAQVEYPPSDSDDDIPLASHLVKSSKPRPKSPAMRQKSAELKKRDAKVKAKTPVKRAPRAKKEEDAPTRKFEKLGQRRETPPENDPTRLFYQSMYREKVALGKKSLTAESWMLRNGLLDDSEAKKVMTRWDLKK